MQQAVVRRAGLEPDFHAVARDDIVAARNLHKVARIAADHHIAAGSGADRIRRARARIGGKRRAVAVGGPLRDGAAVAHHDVAAIAESAVVRRSAKDRAVGAIARRHHVRAV